MTSPVNKYDAEVARQIAILKDRGLIVRIRRNGQIIFQPKSRRVSHEAKILDSSVK